MWFVYLIFQFNQEIYSPGGGRKKEQRAILEIELREIKSNIFYIRGGKYNESIQKGYGSNISYTGGVGSNISYIKG